jgi:hypothetical protein
MSFGDWFSDAVDWLGGSGGDALGSAIKIGTGLYDVFRNHDSAAAAQMSRLLGASINPNDPKFKNLVALFEESNRANAIKNIQNIMNQDARSRARGGGGFIVNPERRDEFRSNALNQAFMDAGEKARLEAAGALSGAATGYGGLIPYQQQQDALRSQQIGALGGMAADAIPGIADLFKGYAPQSYAPTYGPTPGGGDPYFSNVF